MKKLLLVAALFVFFGCNVPTISFSTSAPTSLPTAQATVIVPIQPTAEPGTAANPLILALAPSAHPTDDVLAAGKMLAAQLTTLTNFQVVTVAPTTETDLVHTFEIGNAQIGVLSPFAYLLAYENGNVNASLASIRNGQTLYGAQFIARADAGFTSYFDPASDKNTAEAAQALAQFNNKKPCWSDMASPSGYVVPLGFLKQAKVQVSSDAAFVQGQATVVRAVYGKDICDFGATYIDARALPVLASDYPDVMDKVEVVWRIPPIIPYEQVVVASNLNPEIKRTLLRAFVDLMNTTDGKTAVQKIYGLDTLQPTDDSQYKDFASYVQDSGIDLNTLIK
ncbi:MAG TPA: PhnD/SsuA/transferrin family substrate-binding protein [Anaerolineales bacterium]|nr:PhnD/SsuA/transferrin family substrate-binding protein [Anaerolineales bacterium]